jgi:hypothetical protein
MTQSALRHSRPSPKPGKASHSWSCCSRQTESRHAKAPKDQRIRTTIVINDKKRISEETGLKPHQLMNTKSDRILGDPWSTWLNTPSASAGYIGRGWPYFDFRMGDASPSLNTKNENPPADEGPWSAITPRLQGHQRWREPSLSTTRWIKQ